MGNEAFPWTQMTKEDEYMKVINKAKVILAGEDPTWKGSFPTEIKSIAELELYLFSENKTY